MEILHCSTYDLNGGAAIAAHRLHTALNSLENVTSFMGVQHKYGIDPTVLELKAFRPSILQDLAILISNKLINIHKPQENIYFSNYLCFNNLYSQIKQVKPDIIHLHWIAQFISPYVIKKFSKFNIPVVWTLHDSWAFTGGCHLCSSCQKWQVECKKCPYFQRSFGFDFVNIQWHAKKKAYAETKPIIITPSTFYYKNTQRSSLLKDLPKFHIPNTIDTNTFRPIPKEIARNLLQLEQNQQYILFGAYNATTDKNKGFDLLTSTLKSLSKKLPFAKCLIFGAEDGATLPLQSTFLGKLNDPLSLALAYSAADIFICTSRDENLPNTIMESLACSTPVAAFDIGGISDMVEHQKNGYLAPPFDAEKLAEGITSILSNKKIHEQMSEFGRKSVKQKYSMPIIANHYLELYKTLINERSYEK